jgi:hypothetical protein
MDPMKRALLLVAIVCLASLGCQTQSRMANRGCSSCGPVFGHHHRAHGVCSSGCNPRSSPDYVPYIAKDYDRQMEPAGPPTAQYAYPYYTTRGPRDFFLNNPAPLGY